MSIDRVRMNSNGSYNGVAIEKIYRNGFFLWWVYKIDSWSLNTF